jgi:hypothetical protein
VWVELRNVEEERYQVASNLLELKLRRGTLVDLTSEMEDGEEIELIKRLDN